MERNIAGACTGVPPRTRAGALRIPMALGILTLACATSARAAVGVTPQQILDELASADRARSSQAASEEDWERERRNLDALESGLNTALKQLRESRAKQALELAELQRELAQMEAEAPPRAEAEKLLGQVVNDTQKHLADVARSLLPGIVPDAQTEADHPPHARLLDLVLRLQQAEQAMGAWDAAILDGRLDGETLAAQVLRCGAVAAWWRSLEGNRNGTAVWKDGVLHLSAAASPAEAEGIAAAFAVFEGRRVPETVVLPFGHARREE